MLRRSHVQLNFRQSENTSEMLTDEKRKNPESATSSPRANAENKTTNLKDVQHNLEYTYTYWKKSFLCNRGWLEIYLTRSHQVLGWVAYDRYHGCWKNPYSAQVEARSTWCHCLGGERGSGRAGCTSQSVWTPGGGGGGVGG